MEDNKLKEEIKELVVDAIWCNTWGDSSQEPQDKLYSLTADVANQYAIWWKSKSKNDLSRYFKTLYPVLNEQAFSYFITHIYQPR